MTFISLPNNSFKKLESRVVHSLESVEEIKPVVWSCDPSKAACYDGFDIKFVKEWKQLGIMCVPLLETSFIYVCFDPFINTT